MFTREALGALAEVNRRPIVFALSNPTDRSEVTAENAYAWTEGRAVFASGSPFDPVTLDGRRLEPGQANNVYVFPGIGLGVTAFGIDRVTDEMFLAAATAVADGVSEERLASGSVFPELANIRDVSVRIAAALGRLAFEAKVLTEERPHDLEAFVRARMYDPVYSSAEETAV